MLVFLHKKAKKETFWLSVMIFFIWGNVCIKNKKQTRGNFKNVSLFSEQQDFSVWALQTLEDTEVTNGSSGTATQLPDSWSLTNCTLLTCITLTYKNTTWLSVWYSLTMIFASTVLVGQKVWQVHCYHLIHIKRDVNQQKPKRFVSVNLSFLWKMGGISVWHEADCLIHSWSVVLYYLDGMLF